MPMSFGEQVRATVFLVLGVVCGALGVSIAAREQDVKKDPPVEAPAEPVPPPLVIRQECTTTYPIVCRYSDPQDGAVCYTVQAAYGPQISCVLERR